MLAYIVNIRQAVVSRNKPMGSGTQGRRIQMLKLGKQKAEI
jgi:hypothetical protein